MSIYKKLLKIQSELKAPKGQYNKFGKYYYRNCEDILDALKPFMKANDCTILIKDDIEYINERYYVKSTVTFIDIETGEKIENYAYAREEENKKGMDGSQVTGASSSYARKYALNGLFAIDDTKDSDTTNKSNNTINKKEQQKEEAKPTKNYKREITNMLIQMFGQENAQDELEEYSSFVGKDNKIVKGERETSKLSDKRLEITYGKIKTDYQKWLKQKEAAEKGE